MGIYWPILPKSSGFYIGIDQYSQSIQDCILDSVWERTFIINSIHCETVDFCVHFGIKYTIKCSMIVLWL